MDIKDFILKDFIKITKGTLEERPQIVQMPTLNYEWADSANHCDREWFFSTQGQKAYYTADNYRKKHFYFFNYLESLMHDSNKIINEKTHAVIMNIASIIAYAAGSSDLEFGKYPDILSEDKNPLVKFIVSEDLSKYEKDALNQNDILFNLHEDGEENIDIEHAQTFYLFPIFARILCYFHKGTEPEDFYDLSRKPYDRLIKLKEEGSNTLLNIERMIIWMFSDVRSCYKIDENNNSIIIGNGPFVFQYTLDR